MRGFQFSVQTQSQANYVISLCTKKVMLVLISAITLTFTLRKLDILCHFNEIQ